LYVNIHLFIFSSFYLQTRNKRARLLSEMSISMGATASGGRDAARLDYLPCLRARLFAPFTLAGDKKDDVATAAREVSELLDEYNLSKDDMMETIGEEFVFSYEVPNNSPEFAFSAKGLSSSVKSSFTRIYNSLPHRAQRFGGLPPGASGSFGRKSKLPSEGSLSAAAAESGEVEDVEVEESDSASASEDDQKVIAALRKKGKGASKKGMFYIRKCNKDCHI
jgi:Replication factor RFC1 C terminal domain